MVEKIPELATVWPIPINEATDNNNKKTIITVTNNNN